MCWHPVGLGEQFFRVGNTICDLGTVILGFSIKGLYLAVPLIQIIFVLLLVSESLNQLQRQWKQQDNWAKWNISGSNNLLRSSLLTMTGAFLITSGLLSPNDPAPLYSTTLEHLLYVKLRSHRSTVIEKMFLTCLLFKLYLPTFYSLLYKGCKWTQNHTFEDFQKKVILSVHCLKWLSIQTIKDV